MEGTLLQDTLISLQSGLWLGKLPAEMEVGLPPETASASDYLDASCPSSRVSLEQRKLVPTLLATYLSLGRDRQVVCSGGLEPHLASCLLFFC